MMAKIVVFEGNPTTLKNIKSELREHEITAVGETSPQAFDILGKLACREISADVVVIGDILKNAGRDPEYRFSTSDPPVRPPRNRLLAHRSPVEPLPESFRASAYTEPGRDVKAIADIMQHTGSLALVPIIGISIHAMDDLGVAVERDLTKSNIIQLADAIASVLDI